MPLYMRQWGEIPPDAVWQEKRFPRLGLTEHRLVYERMRGEFRPCVCESGAEVYAHGPAGYQRSFRTVAEAKEWIMGRRAKLIGGRSADIKPDAIDAQLLADRERAWLARSGPRVGDFVIMPDGQRRRFTHAWDSGLQTTWKGDQGSFFLTKSGDCSYSGALDPLVPFARIVDTGDTAEGTFWFFHHDRSGAHRGVECTLPCRVYRVTEEA